MRFAFWSVVPLVLALGLTISPIETEAKPQGVMTLSHNGTLSMDFLSGHWIGQNDSLKVEEIWTSAKDGQWFGTRKINELDNIEYQLISFRYSKTYLTGFVRVLSDELNEPANRVSRFILKVKDVCEEGNALIRFDDNRKLVYRAKDSKTVELTISNDGQEQTIVLKKQ